MDALMLARLQFATTTSIHFLFVILTLGLVTLIVYLQTAWMITKKPVYERLARFWGHLFVINYVPGIATGIIHGAACLALRLPTETGARFARLGARLVPPALVAATAATVRLLNWLALPLIPAIVAFQAMCWWAFRGRVDANAPAFY